MSARGGCKDASRTMGLRRSTAGRHASAHALPPAERSKFEAIFSGVKPKRRGAHARVPAADVSDKRPALARARRRLVRVRAQQPRRLPEVAEMLATESVWQQGARVVGTPAFGVAAVAYLTCAWIAVGSGGSSEELPALRNAGNSPRTAPTAFRGVAPSSAPNHETQGAAPPAVEIDPQFFAGLRRVFESIDERTGYDQPSYPQQEVDDTTPAAEQAPASVPLVVAPAAPDIAPPTQAVVTPIELTPEAEAIGQQPVGPLPGPAA